MHFVLCRPVHRRGSSISDVWLAAKQHARSLVDKPDGQQHGQGHAAHQYENSNGRSMSDRLMHKVHLLRSGLQTGDVRPFPLTGTFLKEYFEKQEAGRC